MPSWQGQMEQDSPEAALQAEMIPRLTIQAFWLLRSSWSWLIFPPSLEVSTKVALKCPKTHFFCVSVVSVRSLKHLILTVLIYPGDVFGTVQSLLITLIFHFLMGGEMHLSRWLSWAFTPHPALQPLLLSRFAPQSPQTGLW